MFIFCSHIFFKKNIILQLTFLFYHLIFFLKKSKTKHVALSLYQRDGMTSYHLKLQRLTREIKNRDQSSLNDSVVISMLCFCSNLTVQQCRVLTPHSVFDAWFCFFVVVKCWFLEEVTICPAYFWTSDKLLQLFMILFFAHCDVSHSFGRLNIYVNKTSLELYSYIQKLSFSDVVCTCDLCMEFDIA